MASGWGDLTPLFDAAEGLGVPAVVVSLEFAAFDIDSCTCDPPHDPAAHDDGFGCTVPDCGCLAEWHTIGGPHG